jgi:hypothetical protein
MSLRTRLAPRRDEHGVAIVLALAFVVLVGVVTAALLSSLTSAVNDRLTLDTVRDRQYAAEAGVEKAVAAVRALGGNFTDCGAPRTSSLNGIAIRVECTYLPTITRTGFLQRNVVFTSCVDTGVACTATTTMIRAQVNFESTGAAGVSHTYIQSWTVTR